MSFILIVIYGIASICLGIGPAIGLAIWKYGFKKKIWFSWLLGGLFWMLALLARYYLLIIIVITPELAPYNLFLAALLAGVFETSFRVLLLLLLTKFTASSTEKLVMAGVGWGSVEAIIVHSIPLFSLIFITSDSEVFTQLEGLEWTILFGGFERIMAEIFHLIMMVLVFYGLKHKLKNIEKSEPLINNFFTREPKPLWIWVIIVMALHFALDFVFILLLYSVGVILMYMLMFVVVGILYSYLSNRVKFYPLFPQKDHENK